MREHDLHFFSRGVGAGYFITYAGGAFAHSWDFTFIYIGTTDLLRVGFDSVLSQCADALKHLKNEKRGPFSFLVFFVCGEL